MKPTISQITINLLGSKHVLQHHAQYMQSKDPKDILFYMTFLAKKDGSIEVDKCMHKTREAWTSQCDKALTLTTSLYSKTLKGGTKTPSNQLQWTKFIFQNKKALLSNVIGINKLQALLQAKALKQHSISTVEQFTNIRH